jgi:TRAP-type C4-dicarboxylate transport system permease small subunit
MANIEHGYRSPAARLSGIAAAIGGAALIGIMLMTVADIAGRHLGFPAIRGLAEWSGLATILLATFGLSYCFLVGGHIVIDIATAWMKPGTVRRIDAAWSAAGALVLLVLAIQVAREGVASAQSGETSAALAWSPLVYALPAAAGFAGGAVTCLVMAFLGGRRSADSTH